MPEIFSDKTSDIGLSSNVEVEFISPFFTTQEEGEEAYSLVSLNNSSSIVPTGDISFADINSTEITAPYGIIMIASGTFRGFHNLEKIKIPDSVVSIGDDAFRECTHLKKVDLPKHLNSIGDSVFWGCVSLETIQIPEDVISIGNYAFYGCTKLREINIPDSVQWIGVYAFYECGFEEIYIPESTLLAYPAFSNCKNLRAVITINPIVIKELIEKGCKVINSSD